MAHTTTDYVQSYLPIKTYAYYFFVLKEYLKELMGKNYPKKIFGLILLRINIPVALNFGIASPTIVKNPYYESNQKKMCAMLCLNKYVGNNYPKELVHMISTIAYKPLKIQCGRREMKVFITNKVYSWHFKSKSFMGLNYNADPYLFSKQSIWDLGSSTELAWSIQYDFLDIPRPNLIKKIKRSSLSTLILLKSGKLYEYGNRMYLNLINVTKFDCGLYHMVAVSNDKMYVWGANYHGQLGLGDEKAKSMPHELDLELTLADTDYPIRSFSCGDFHTILLTNAGHVYVWGSNNHGFLGGIIIRSPCKINLNLNLNFKIPIPKFIKTYACEDYSILVSDANTVYFCESLNCHDLFTEIRLK